MGMDNKLWYKLLGKEDAFDRSLFYNLNEKFDPGDPTNYELDLGNGKKFSFNKNTKKVFFEDKKNTVLITLLELKKIVAFAKKNGAI